jgi:hypothetical protein
MISKTLKEKVTGVLLKNNQEFYTASITNVNFKLLKRSIIIDGISLVPKSASLLDLKNNESEKKALQFIHISSLELHNIELYQALFHDNIQISELKINDLNIEKFLNSDKKSVKKPFNLDSISIQKINGFEIDKIRITNFTYLAKDFFTDKLIFQNKPIDLELSGFKLEKYSENLFQLKPTNNQLEINNLDIDFPDKKYALHFDLFAINFEKKLIEVEKLVYKPTIDKYKLAQSYRFNSEVFQLDLDKLTVYNYNLSSFLNNQGIFMDSIAVSKLNLDIYKDKRKPFDQTKRPQLPHTLLKKMDFPLDIKKISVTNSAVKIEETIGKNNMHMNVSLEDIYAEITNITSIKQLQKEPLKISTHSKLMGKGDINVTLLFPLNEKQSTFYFSGRLGPTKFIYFDSAIFPALGLKVLTGDLQELTFEARANEVTSSGKMTMLYSDLKAQVFKHESDDQNDFLSWTLNTVLHTSNPQKNGKVREVLLNHERVPYKGTGSYLWKTLQSGITNTISPFGKTTKKKKNSKGKKKA